MHPHWIGFLVFVWVMGLLIGSVPVGEMMTENETVTDPVQGVLSYAEIYSEEDWGTLLIPTTHLNFFGDLFDLLVLDLPLFGAPDSPWQMVRWIALSPIIATVVFGLIILFITIFWKQI